MNSRDERIARNEALFRAVNQEIERVSEQFGDQDLEVLCECGRSGCRDVLAITATEYERVHRQEDRFVVAHAHANPEIERVVNRTAGYVIVDKFGEAEEIVEDAAG